MIDKIDKKELLFQLRNYIKFFPLNDLREIFCNACSVDDCSFNNYSFNNNHIYKGIKIIMTNNVYVKVYDDSSILWFKNERIHRDDKPAVMDCYFFEWYNNGKYIKRKERI